MHYRRSTWHRCTDRWRQEPSNPTTVTTLRRTGDMLLRYAILGLLDGEEMHGYRMKSAFERRLGSLWSANFGQIYGSLKDLRRRGLVTGRLETGTGHLSRWTYTITAKGR